MQTMDLFIIRTESVRPVNVQLNKSVVNVLFIYIFVRMCFILPVSRTSVALLTSLSVDGRIIND
jgi:hypothetical protein